MRAWLADVDDGKIAPGMPAVVTLDAYPGRTFPGTVRDISPVAQTQGQGRQQGQRRVFTVGVELGRGRRGHLAAGALGAGRGAASTASPDVVLVPRAALDLAGESPRAAAGERRRARTSPWPAATARTAWCRAGSTAGTALRRATP